MAINVTLRWASPGQGTYKIERSLDGQNWTVLAAAQASTAPHTSVVGSLASNTAYGATNVSVNGSSFPATGYAWIDDEALIQWTGNSANILSGVTWHSGSGVYAAGTQICHAHESYTDSGVNITNLAALYRITFTAADGSVSPPTYMPYYAPPVPASSRHCVVVVSLNSDLGFEPRANVTVTCQIAGNDQFIDAPGTHLGRNTSSANAQTTNALGLACWHCFINEGLVSQGGGAPSGYVFTIDGSVIVRASVIPDKDWVLLEDIADA